MRKLQHREISRISFEERASVAPHPIVVILENLRSAHNVGSIIRTCDAALIDRLIVSGYTPRPDHPKVSSCDTAT